MNEYTSCFIGIPIPDQFQTEFEEIIQSLLKVPKVEVVSPKTPHITLCYLKPEAQLDLITISEIIKPLIVQIPEISVEVGGVDFFSTDPTLTIFLRVIYPPELTQLQKQLTEKLVGYVSLENQLDFHPHVTIGRVEDRVALEKIKQYLTELINKKWRFELTQLYLYGVDSTIKPEFQEKLIGIER